MVRRSLLLAACKIPIAMGLIHQVACGPKTDSMPTPTGTCGKRGHLRSTAATTGTRTTHERVAEAQQALEDPDGQTVYEVPLSSAPQVVQIRFYLDGEPAHFATGVVVGGHSVLTAAHPFLDFDYDYVAIAVAPRTGPHQGTLVETPPIQYLLNRDYVERYHATDGEPGWSDDSALIEVAIDFEELGIERSHIESDYVPPCDSNGCPIETLTLMGWGSDTATELTQLELRGVEVTPGNSSSNIRDEGLIIHDPRTNNGDSGGPVYRFNAERSRRELIGLMLGDDDSASEQYEVNPGPGDGRGDRLVSVATTLTAGLLDDLRSRGLQWSNQSHGDPFGSDVQYPRPTRTLPNGRPNPTFTSYPETGPAGPATPLFSTHHQDGYFVGEYPFPLVTPAPKSCGK
jgi:hypothetical protein